MTEDKKQRKESPMARGLLDYFPDALVAIAHVSYVGNEQHNPGEPLHWSKDKSSDHADCIIRHLIERGTTDTDGLSHSAKAAWRALALLQIELDTRQALSSPAYDAPETNAPGAFRPQKPRVYISGPMRGYKDSNFPAFRAAKALLEDSFDVVSPVDMHDELGPCPTQDGYVERDIAALRTCDAIYLLHGWGGSIGAKAELAVAKWLELDVMYESETN